MNRLSLVKILRSGIETGDPVEVIDSGQTESRGGGGGIEGGGLGKLRY